MHLRLLARPLFALLFGTAIGLDDLDEPSRRRIRAAQIDAVVALVPLTMTINILNVAVVDVVFWDVGATERLPGDLERGDHTPSGGRFLVVVPKPKPTPDRRLPTRHQTHRHLRGRAGVLMGRDAARAVSPCRPDAPIAARQPDRRDDFGRRLRSFDRARCRPRLYLDDRDPVGRSADTGRKPFVHRGGVFAAALRGLPVTQSRRPRQPVRRPPARRTEARSAKRTYQPAAARFSGACERLVVGDRRGRRVGARVGSLRRSRRQDLVRTRRRPVRRSDRRRVRIPAARDGGHTQTHGRTHRVSRRHLAGSLRQRPALLADVGQTGVRQCRRLHRLSRRRLRRDGQIPRGRAHRAAGALRHGDGAAEPGVLPGNRRPRADRGARQRHHGGAAVSRSRPVQIGQRHARSSRRRRAAQAGRQAHPGLRPRPRFRRPAGRRRIRHPAARPRSAGREP